MNKATPMLLFPDLYALKCDALDLVYRSYPRSMPQKKEPVPGRVIWHAHQGTMRVRTGAKLTKAEKKAEKKERAALKTSQNKPEDRA